MVTVHHFKVWSIATGEYVVSPRKATMETVREAKGEAIPGAAEQVNETGLDGQGFMGGARHRSARECHAVPEARSAPPT
jgi:hypothetical protein